MINDAIQLAHGGGGRLTRELIETEIVSRFGNGPLRGLPDGATLPSPRDRLVFTTDIRFMRDPTRGGAATVLNEMAEGRMLDVLLKEQDIPLSTGTRAVSEILGLDPLHVASEGRTILVCEKGVATKILAKWRSMPEGRSAAVIGTMTTGKGRVILETVTGGRRLVDVPRGELLPRIC